MRCAAVRLEALFPLSVKSFLQFLLFVLVITLALAGLYAWKSGQFETSNAAPAAPHALPDVKPALGAGSLPGLAALDAEFGRLAEAVVPSVVSITARRGGVIDPREELLRQLFGMRRRVPPETFPQGSGVIISEQGHIVTSLHVIDGASEIAATLSDGRRLPATLLGYDETLDIAVMKIEASSLRPLPFADSEKVRAGQLVFAVGNPFGLQETITQGIISARERLFSSESDKEFFQTDAPINPGNSGGPLVDIRGEIVGINNFIFSQSGGSQGIGFAIPSNAVRRVVDEILSPDRSSRPMLGVALRPLDEELAAQLGLPDARGALVEAVGPDSPAARAGIRPGDLIVKFNDREIRDFGELRRRVAQSKIGEELPLEVVRDGRRVSLKVKLAEEPRSGRTALPAPPAGGVVPQPLPLPPAPPAGGGNALAGVSVADATPALVDRFGLPDNVEGVVVQSVGKGSPAEGILQTGDAIEQINDTPVTSRDNFVAAVAALPPGERCIVLLSRGRVRSFAVVGP
jgi:Do/DeqQ family serine protease